jgi:hypothetical protein
VTPDPNVNQEVSSKLKEFLKEHLDKIDEENRDLVFRYAQVLQTHICNALTETMFLTPLLILLGADRQAQQRLLDIQVSTLRFVLQTAEAKIIELKNRKELQ